MANGPKFKKITGNDVPTTSFDSLPEEEKRKMIEFNPVMAKQMGYKPEKPQTVSVVKHNEEVEKLNKQIADLKEKLETARKERDGYHQERDSYRERFEKKLAEVKDLEQSSEKVRNELRTANSELEELRRKPKAVPAGYDGELVRARNDLRTVNGKLETANNENADLKGRIAEAASEKEALISEKNGLEEQVLELRRKLKEYEEPSLPDMEDVGSITMTGPATLRSDLFTARRYSVRLAKDMSYIKFRPDAEGLVICDGNTMTIPSLPNYVRYTGDREFPAAGIDGMFMIRLV